MNLIFLEMENSHILHMLLLRIFWPIGDWYSEQQNEKGSVCIPQYNQGNVARFVFFAIVWTGLFLFTTNATYIYMGLMALIGYVSGHISARTHLRDIKEHFPSGYPKDLLFKEKDIKIEDE